MTSSDTNSKGTTMTATLPKATKRNSIEICGQLWHFRKQAYWSPCRGIACISAVYVATRYSDGRTVTGSDKAKLAAIIADRITEGFYG
jgi:hypothetical protein